VNGQAAIYANPAFTPLTCTTILVGQQSGETTELAGVCHDSRFYCPVAQAVRRQVLCDRLRFS